MIKGEQLALNVLHSLFFFRASFINRIPRRWLTEDVKAKQALRTWHDLCTSLCDLNHQNSIAVLFHARVARKKELVSHLWLAAEYVLYGMEEWEAWEELGVTAWVEMYLNEWKCDGECSFRLVINTSMCLSDVFFLSTSWLPR